MPRSSRHGHSSKESSSYLPPWRDSGQTGAVRPRLTRVHLALLGVLTAVMIATPTALILKTTMAATPTTTSRACGTTAHPDWAVTYPVNAPGSRLYFNPGIPEARRYVEDSILDAVRRYDIDGVHFDDFFYPYPAAKQDFGDDATYATYGKGFATKADWR